MSGPTATTRLRAELQEYASNEESWGGHLNVGSLQVLDDAIAGWAEVPVAANYTLDAANFVEDEARMPMLKFTGAGGFEVTAPAVSKFYIVWNACAADVTLKPAGGTAATIKAGRKTIWITNGTVGYSLTLNDAAPPTSAVDFNSQKASAVAPGTVATDAATLANKVHDFAAPTAALAMNGQKITGQGAATSTTDSATLANKIHEFTLATAALVMNSQKITGLADGVLSTDAANVGQVTSISAPFASAAAASATDADASADAALASQIAAAASAAAALASEIAAAASAAQVAVLDNITTFGINTLESAGLTANQVVIGGTTSTLAPTTVATGIAGQLLQSNGASAPSWVTNDVTAATDFLFALSIARP